jgi:hypothetical protein
MAASARETAAPAPLPPPPKVWAVKSRSPSPSAALRRTGSFLSMYDTKPWTSPRARPASSTARRTAVQASWNSVSVARPRS